MKYDVKNSDKTPVWLRQFPVDNGFPLLSQPARFAHDETKYDEQYLNEPADLSVGQGVVNLLKEQGADVDGPAVEMGCGTGVLTLGLLNSNVFPHFIVTDPSPVFLDITYAKTVRAGVPVDRLSLAVLKGEEISRLPKNEFSLVVLRSTLHHVLDVQKFIHDAAAVLKPGGRLVFQEPCTEGYILMGSIAQFIPLVMKQARAALTKQHEDQIKLFIDTMQFYARRDIDKSAGEDKHLFRVDEIMDICASAGLSLKFFPNQTFEYFDKPKEQRENGHTFYSFFYNYLKYCMSFDQRLMGMIDAHFRRYCDQVGEITRSNEPYMHGVFMCRKR